MFQTFFMVLAVKSHDYRFQKCSTVSQACREYNQRSNCPHNSLVGVELLRSTKTQNEVFKSNCYCCCFCFIFGTRTEKFFPSFGDESQSAGRGNRTPCH